MQGEAEAVSGLRMLGVGWERRVWKVGATLAAVI
jgi:hypothetical protein